MTTILLIALPILAIWLFAWALCRAAARGGRDE